MNPIARSKRRAASALVALICLCIALFLKFSPTSEAVKPNALAPVLNATKTGALQTDVNGNGFVNPGDGVRYLVTINNTGPDAANDVAINDTIDANTTLVGGSVIASAIAVNDSYSAVGNVGITVPDGPSDLLANDLDANNLVAPVRNITQINGAAVTFGVPMNTANGQVTVNANGSFSFNPNPGFEGNATFAYTLSNGTSLTDTATVTVNVSGMIWFVNPAAAGGGDGRLNSPFNCFVGTNCFDDTTADDPGDNIFLYSGAHIGGQTLLNNQRLIGQGATTALTGVGSITGIIVPTFSNALPATGGATPTMTTVTAATNAITLGSGNTIRGITFGNTTGAKLFAAASVGTLTIGPAANPSDVTLNGNGQAISLTGGGTLAARFASISSTNANQAAATTGITLTSVGGSFVSPTTTITNPNGIGINIGSSSATFDLGNTTANQSGGTGVSLTSNTGTITFADLDIAPDAGQRGLLATGNTGAITTTSGTLSTTNGTAAEITGVSALSKTPLNVSLTSVSVTGNASGIRVINTSTTGSPGGFRILGTASNAASGGTISNISGADGSNTAGIGIYLDNVSDITLQNMTFSGTFGNFGIRGDNVTNFTLRDSNLGGTFGSNDGLNEGTIRFGTENLLTTSGMRGTALFEGNTIGGGWENTVSVYVYGTDTLNMTVQDSASDPAVFNDQSSNFGDDALHVGTGGTGSNLTLLVNGVRFNGARGDQLQTHQIGVTTQTITITNNEFLNTAPNIVSGGGGVWLLGGDTANTSNVNVDYVFSGNTIKNSQGDCLRAVYTGYAGTISGLILNNTIGTVGGGVQTDTNGGSVAGGAGINVGHAKGEANSNVNAGTINHAVRVEGNTVRDIQNAFGGIMITNGSKIGGLSRLEATIKNNTVAEVGPDVLSGFYAIGGGQGNADVSKTGIILTGNSFTAGPVTGGSAIFLDFFPLSSANYYFPGYTVTANSSRGENVAPAGGTASASLEAFWVPQNGTLINGPFPGPTGNPATGKKVDAGTTKNITNDPFVLAVPTLAAIKSGATDQRVDNFENYLDLQNASLQSASEMLAWIKPSSRHPLKPEVFSTQEIATTEVVVSDLTAEVHDTSYFTSIRTFVTERVGVMGEAATSIGSMISPTVYAQTDLAPESGENVSKTLGTLPPGENIRVQFDVTVDANIPTNDFSVANTASISSTNHITFNSSTATTTVVHPPIVSKAFNATNITVGGTATLTFTVTNQNPATVAGDITVNDNFPAGLTVAVPLTTTNTCGGTLQDNTGGVLAAGDVGIRLTGGSRAAGQSCTFSVVVSGVTDGVKNNVTGNISSTQGGTGLTAAATLTVITAPSFSKAFGAATIPLTGSTSLSFTITNNSANTQLSGVGFTDNLPAGLVVATPPGTTGSCGGGTITANQGAGSITLAGATLAASTNCTFSVNVTGTTAGGKNNSAQLTSGQLGLGASANASVIVVAPPTIAKSFSPTSVLANNGFSTMTIAITNPGPNTVALTGVAVTDTFPAGMEVDTVPTATNSCATGTFAPVAAATSVSITGATIPPTAICNFTVRVRGTTAGAKVNTTGNVTSTNGGQGLTASATLTVTNTVTWNGATSSVWTTNTNWTPNVVPVSTNDVDIPGAGVVNNPVIGSAVTVNNLTEAAGRTLTINSTFSLTATGTCTINGTMTVIGTFSCGSLAGTGTVNFQGGAGQSIPALTYNNLNMNNGGGANLVGDTTVNGALTFTNGVINTGANTLTVGTGGTTTRTAGHVVGNLRKLFNAPGTFVFHVGTGADHSPVTDTVTAMIAPTGELTVRANTGVAPGPGLDSARTLLRHWTLTGSGIRSNLTFQYLNADVPVTTNEAIWNVIRVTGTTAVRYPAGPDVILNAAANTFAINNVEVYSHWTAGEPLAPTAANANVSGRVTDTSGRGVYGARISMQDQAGNVVYAITNPFGYYRFTGVQAGQSYLMSPVHKRFEFQPRTITVSDDLVGIDFIAIEP